MQDSGGLVSAAVNAACLSLLDACVPMKFLVAAVACTVSRDGSVLLDPSSRQLRSSAASLVFVFESRTRSVVSTHSEGLVTQEKLQECLTVSRTAVEKVFQFYRQVVARKFSKEV